MPAKLGVPQTRKRLLFVGVRAGLGMTPPRLQGTGATDAVTLMRVPGPRGCRYQVVVQESLLSMRMADALGDPDNLSVVTVADALSDIADLPVGNRLDGVPYEELAAPGPRRISARCAPVQEAR